MKKMSYNILHRNIYYLNIQWNSLLNIYVNVLNRATEINWHAISYYIWTYQAWISNIGLIHIAHFHTTSANIPQGENYVLRWKKKGKVGVYFDPSSLAPRLSRDEFSGNSIKERGSHKSGQIKMPEKLLTIQFIFSGSFVGIDSVLGDGNGEVVCMCEFNGRARSWSWIWCRFRMGIIDGLFGCWNNIVLKVFFLYILVLYFINEKII